VATAKSKGTNNDHKAKHVLLISVDGLHQYDLQHYIKLHPDSTLADLAKAGTEYTNASTTSPSDSFPGLLAPLTGGTSKSTGVFYDDSYDRTAFAAPAQIRAGTQDCKGAPGAEMVYAENLDVNAPTFNNPTGTRTILHEKIDPAQLPRSGPDCKPLYPNDFLRTNTVFSVAHAAGMLTAWSDKHPAYQIVNGQGTPHAVTDLFTPEINADKIPVTLKDTRNKTITFPFPNPDGKGSTIITDYVGDTEAYDQIKVDAILNEIDGMTSRGEEASGTPAIFGMNFQSVSVGQKDVDPTLCVRKTGVCQPGYFKGGYFPSTDGGQTFKFTPQMDGVTHYPGTDITVPGALNFVDASLAAMVKELKANNLYSSTQIIIEAKHGQSPIDPDTLHKIGSPELDVLSAAKIDVIQPTEDDVALIWLSNQTQTDAAVKALEDSMNNGNPARIARVLSGTELAGLYNDPKVDNRTPDIIVEPIPGTIYTSSNKKVAEHGGFAPDDIHVALLVINGGSAHGGTVSEHVTTTQIAPTILTSLGLDPSALDAVKMEGTQPLPGASSAD
jgi:hypothetical protein